MNERMNDNDDDDDDDDDEAPLRQHITDIDDWLNDDDAADLCAPLYRFYNIHILYYYYSSK